MRAAPESYGPALLLGTVMHARLRPRANRFAYNVYQLRLPLRRMARGGAAWPGATGRVVGHNRFGLMSFHDRDHGDGVTPLTTWIDGILHAHGIGDAAGEVWLHCFPRVLGYVFNPVSFWFCHRADGALRAILCEVNNTFGERHCYLLANEDGAPLVWGQQLAATKQFHVSPFCPVEGGYRFQFRQPAPDRHDARIDYHDAQGMLLLTSISGEARRLSARSALAAFVSMPFMTLGVILRIHWQALRLWWRGTPFFTKPSPPVTQVSR